MQAPVKGRRGFIKVLGGVGLIAALPPLAADAAPTDMRTASRRRLLILVDLRGGNDGLNTVVPYADPAYHALRPHLGIGRSSVIQIDETAGLHPSLAPLRMLWQARELAVVQGLGYPQPNLSHFRSTEIWDTASNSGEYLQESWLARTFDMNPLPAGFAHSHSTSGLASTRTLRTEFPAHPFGKAVEAACHVIAGGSGVAALRLTLDGFDTHRNQSGAHAGLLKQLAEGLIALRAGLKELDCWQDSLVLTCSEFGRRPRENQSNGTDHGTASAHFVLGARVRGGLHGAAPNLGRLDGNGHMPFAVDFRSLYATVLEQWWHIDSAGILGGRFEPLPLLRT